MEETGCLSKSIRKHFLEIGLVLGYFVNRLRKQGFALDRVTSRSRGHSMCGYRKFYVTKGKARQMKAVTRFRIGVTLGHFGLLDNVHILPMFRHDYRVVLFLSWSSMVTKRPFQLIYC